jgi:type IX secretion system PorP/SprF family membrane protein
MASHIPFILLLLFYSLQISAQQTSLYSQYMFNGLAINPAYAGTHEYLNVTALARKQWIGVDGAPSTMTFSAHTPMKNDKVSLGLLFYGDKIGIFKQYSMNGIYAYKIHLNEKTKLSFGLQAGVTNYVARYSELTSKDPNDPNLSQADVSGYSPSFGAGIYYYSEKFYLGLSSPFLLNNLLKSQQVANSFRMSSTYFLTSGVVLKISDEVKLKPSTLIKYTAGAPVQIDLNTNFLFHEVLWVGASLRNFSSVNFLVQFNVNEQLRIGYDYDLNLNKVSSLYRGSHEIMLNYFFSFSQKNVVTPRYF